MRIQIESHATRYVRTHLVGPLAWSPGPGSIVAVKANAYDEPTRTLLRLAADGSSLGQFLSLQRRTAIRHVQWSPDGRRLALETREPWIYVVAPDGSGLRRLVKGTWPAWRP